MKKVLRLKCFAAKNVLGIVALVQTAGGSGLRVHRYLLISEQIYDMLQLGRSYPSCTDFSPYPLVTNWKIEKVTISISMVIFKNFNKLPEGKSHNIPLNHIKPPFSIIFQSFPMLPEGSLDIPAWRKRFAALCACCWPLGASAGSQGRRLSLTHSAPRPAWHRPATWD